MGDCIFILQDDSNLVAMRARAGGSGQIPLCRTGR